MTTALVMAGGRGERMRASGTVTPKPMVVVGGLTLLERNLLALLARGIGDIVVATPAHSPEITEFVHARCGPLVSSRGGELRVYEERQPLGNIGAAAEVECRGPELLVVFADNLTALDLTALIRHHRQAGASLTTAVHYEPFRIPFGEVEVRDGLVVAYTEKPAHRVLVSSGLLVLSPAAVARIPRGRPTGISALANQLLAEGERIAAFSHDAPWIDVNDSSAAERAARLLAERTTAGWPGVGS
ncbi:MAG TPA: sugar phosphate nucleotidyltransferase [Gemmatimonadales bacterium]|nr:sugar phosphate nucleotidyltransferase [Gemmatimonadales bacterium]